MPDAPRPPQPATPLTLAEPPRPSLWSEPYLWFGGAFLIFYFAGMVIGWTIPTPDLDFGGGGGGSYHSSGGSHSGGGFSFGGK